MKRGMVLFLVVMVLWGRSSGAAELSDIDIHGFISQGYLLSDDNNFLGDSEDGTFQFSEFGINFGKQLTDRLHVGIQFFGRDLGPIGNNEVEIDWAYADYHWKDWAGVRVGAMRLLDGFYNETRDIDMLRSSILLPQSVYSEIVREFFSRMYGGGIYGEISAGPAGRFSYQFLVGSSDVDEEGGIARIIEASGLFELESYHNGTVYNGGLRWHLPVEGLRIGVTGFKSENISSERRLLVPLGPTMPAGGTLKSENDEFHSFVLSAEYTWHDLVVAAEYREMKVREHLKDIPSSEFVQEPLGYYVSASYRFTDWFELGTYYSVYYTDEDDKDGDNLEAMGFPDFMAWQKDLALTTRFDINENWVVKLEGHVMDGAAMLFSQDNPDGVDEDWFFFAAKVTFSF